MVDPRDPDMEYPDPQEEPGGTGRENRPGPNLNLIRAAATVLAALGVLTLLHFAASVFMTLFSSMLLAFALEPLVHVICVRTRMRRQFASGIVVFLFIAFLYGLGYFAYTTAVDFVTDLPTLLEKIQEAPLVNEIVSKTRNAARIVEDTGRRFLPGGGAGGPGTGVGGLSPRDAESIVGALLKNLGSLTGVVFSLSFIPFLVYFMLADREPLTRRTRELFPEEYHHTVGVILLDVERMMRKFLLGNAILVGILSAATILAFWAVGLPNPIVLGGISGTLSVIPYLGLPLALLPGVLVGVVHFESLPPILVVVASVTLLHLVSANYLTPKLVGGEVHLNATASTTSLLFFGWLWGGMGLLLAIPILAVLKCVLENVPSTRRIGFWLGD
ncbi:MAG: AI-2E family transporter [Deltaproteobacteria bacterium]|nr:MAG: AI-2E family transporter [Deltaproteobacteria bacterium]